MRALPTGPWQATPTGAVEAPFAAEWQLLGSVAHVFTHFALNLRLLCAEAEERGDGLWWPIHRLDEAGLPTVFAKAAARAAAWQSAA